MQPNIVLIVTDNQAADLLGCYGNSEMYSPRLDAMAAGGVRFDNAFCPNAMCSPCRASILTGRMPSQHGVHTWLDDRARTNWPTGWNAVADFETLPELLKSQGYATALIGKYHLGDVVAGHNGIDHWVTMAHGHTLNFHGNMMNVNGVEELDLGHSVEFFTRQAIDWISGQSRGQPFFLILTYNGPYGHWPSIKGAADNRFFERYQDMAMTSVPREGLCAETIALYDLQKGLSRPGGPDFSALLKVPNDLTSLRNYYSQMSLIDDCVGQVLDALEACRQTDDTLVTFTSDHGFSLGHHGYWGHGQATWPSSMYRASYNIPLIMTGPGIDAGEVRDQMLSSIDLFATLTAIGGAVVTGDDIPSRDFSGILLGDTDGSDAVFFEQEESRAIRTRDWLFVQRFKGSETYPLTDQLFDLQSDPGERRNVSGQADLASAETALRGRLEAYFNRYMDPRYDLWSGGSVKSNTARPWLWRDAWGAGWGPVT